MHLAPEEARLAELTQPLLAAFGEQLRLVREGNAVCWTYAGSSVRVELRSGGAIAATFVAPAVGEGELAEQLRAIYAPRTPVYPPTQPGVARMVEDLTAFFLGAREPRFTFVDLRRGI